MYNFCIDVDGVLTDGKFIYSINGKMYKNFGPDDHDALNLIEPFFNIHFVTADKRGFEISKRRIVDDMKKKLSLVGTSNRLDWIKTELGTDRTVYMGDGFFDSNVFRGVMYSIAPNDAFFKTKEAAHFITKCNGGQRAVAEACIHLMDKFYPDITFL